MGTMVIVQMNYSDLLLKTIARIAPGTELREGLERIMRGRTGALIVLGSDRTVSSMSSGGFSIDTEFSATLLRELAKMDGAIICDRDATRLLHAAVQLMPDASIETNESGTRHRTAERTAIQTGFPVISVSASMSVISVYVDGTRYMVEDSQYLMARANQAIQTLESYKKRLRSVLSSLSALEIESNVSLADVAMTLQRMEMVNRIIREVSHYVLELGVHGRLIALQLEELRSPEMTASDLILRDYLPEVNDALITAGVEALQNLNDMDIVDLRAIARTVGFGENPDLELPLQPRGFRLLAGIPSIPNAIAERLVERFGSLQALMAASLEDLRAVDGVGEARARTVREQLTRMAESSLERYL